jgi:hypothetical protein
MSFSPGGETFHISFFRPGGPSGCILTLFYFLKKTRALHSLRKESNYTLELLELSLATSPGESILPLNKIFTNNHYAMMQDSGLSQNWTKCTVCALQLNKVYIVTLYQMY